MDRADVIVIVAELDGARLMRLKTQIEAYERKAAESTIPLAERLIFRLLAEFLNEMIKEPLGIHRGR